MPQLCRLGKELIGFFLIFFDPIARLVAYAQVMQRIGVLLACRRSKQLGRAGMILHHPQSQIVAAAGGLAAHAAAGLAHGGAAGAPNSHPQGCGFGRW